MGGMVLETNMTEILTRIEEQTRIEKQEVTVARSGSCCYHCGWLFFVCLLLHAADAAGALHSRRAVLWWARSWNQHGWDSCPLRWAEQAWKARGNWSADDSLTKPSLPPVVHTVLWFLYFFFFFGCFLAVLGCSCWNLIVHPCNVIALFILCLHCIKFPCNTKVLCAFIRFLLHKVRNYTQRNESA